MSPALGASETEPMEADRSGDAAAGAILEARRDLRAPWAAGVAGILFAVLFTLSLILLRTQPLLSVGDSGIAAVFATGGDTPAMIGGLYFAPFAGIAFLWFIAVVRDQVGEREDRFFATVFLGSGLIFVTLVFMAAAIASSQLVGVNYLGQPPPTRADVEANRALAYTVLFVFATRAGAVFLISTATIALRSGTFPRAFALAGYVLALMLLLLVAFYDWVILALPLWVAVISLYILRRERGRRRSSPVPASA
jgi:hypothetical protein